LIAAARIAFAERGYAGASVETIAEAAGFSKGALYFHFPSKEALALALVTPLIEAVVDERDALLSKLDGGPEGFYSAYVQFAELTLRDRVRRMLEVELALQAGRDATIRAAFLPSLHNRWAGHAKLLECASAALGGRPVAEFHVIGEAMVAMAYGYAVLHTAGAEITPLGVLFGTVLRALLRLGEAKRSRKRKSK
jgi:AcrR family transcriptional regulator